MIETQEEKKPLAVLAAISPSSRELPRVEQSLDELDGLLSTAGGVTYARVVQLKETPDKATFLGSGKIEEIRDLIADTDVSLVIFDSELTPSQIKNIENVLNKEDIRVIDRTMLILDIFALHAKTGEGMLQVEIAHLKYTMPRLLGRGKDLSRLGGGIGTRGPGESKLEMDRRYIKRRILRLSEELEELENKRTIQRSAREKSGIPQIAIAGYTNVGKSTLLNRLTDAGILAENKLFATLDPTTRRFRLPNFGDVLLTDTVGFINNLPHHLVEAFKSTLDEVVFADMILILLDASSEEIVTQYMVTESIINGLFERDERPRCPVVYVLNKIDSENANQTDLSFLPLDNTVRISACTGEGIESLIAKIELILASMKKKITFLFPYSMSSALSRLYKTGNVLSADYEAEGIRVVAYCEQKEAGLYEEYII